MCANLKQLNIHDIYSVLRRVCSKYPPRWERKYISKIETNLFLLVIFLIFLIIYNNKIICIVEDLPESSLYIVSHVSWQLCQWLLKSITKVLRDPMVSPKHKVSPSLLRGIVSKLIHLCPNQINNKIALTKEDEMIYIFE